MKETQQTTNNMEAEGKTPQEDSIGSPRHDMEEQTKDKDDPTGVIPKLHTDSNIFHSKQAQTNDQILRTATVSVTATPTPATEGRSGGSHRTENHKNKKCIYKPPLQDPLEKATQFLVKHNIIGLFQVCLVWFMTCC